MADPAAARSRVPMRGTVLHTGPRFSATHMSHPTIWWQKRATRKARLPAEAQLSTHTHATRSFYSYDTHLTQYNDYELLKLIGQRSNAALVV